MASTPARPVNARAAEPPPAAPARPAAAVRPQPSPQPQAPKAPAPRATAEPAADPVDAKAPEPAAPRAPVPPPETPASPQTPQVAAAPAAPAARPAEHPAEPTAAPQSDGGDTESHGPPATAGSGLPSAAEHAAREDYAAALQAWLARHKRYPRRARLRGIEGTVLVAFAVDREGRLVHHEIRRGSGHSLLDREVQGMVQRANPFPEMPAHLETGEFQLVVPVRFALR